MQIDNYFSSSTYSTYYALKPNKYICKFTFKFEGFTFILIA